MPAIETSGEVVEALLEGWSPAGSPRWLQVAAAGRWEDARGLDMPADPGAARALVQDAGPSGADIAAEFEWLAPPLVFVGARRRSGDDDGPAFEAAVGGLAAREPAGPSEALARLAGGPPEGPAHVELGAANAWQSVGPVRLWSAGDGRAPGTPADLLRDRPDLVRCVAPVALEVAFDGPRSCWIGIELSERTPDGHALQLPRLEGLLARLLSA